MLNSTIAMFKPLLVLSFIFFAQTAAPSILSPQSGQTLRGQVEIIGNLNVPNFSSAELAFSYASDANSWFAIQTFTQIPTTQTLATWDTALIADGDYDLHLRVVLQDGASQDIVTSDLKIRNDTLPVADTVTPTEESSLLSAATLTPTVDIITVTPIFSTPTSLPANPVSVTPTSIYGYLARGGLIALVLFALFSLILRLRKN